MPSAPIQSPGTSSAIFNSPEALTDPREHPVAGVTFPDSFQVSQNRTPSLLTHSPRRTYSTPLIQQPPTIVARCVASPGPQDALLWGPGLYLSSRAPVSYPARPKRSSVGSNMANALTSGHSCGKL
ncbi:hypothetical protein HO173_003933 [Letharia columbiana]|uniref:Uncharacterized protein n=1 Tax=Letharia columbiana TaxID=112416 RepID=A0A8H6FZQ9_9LECA|nr:uncharacterized protein HO173_003933 [Letharia columbiana]KAF6237732.1 hypothetical protein HO173_003933 [Letharia columbiana]